MRKFFKIFTLFLPIISIGQINYQKNWNTDTAVGWSSSNTGSSYNLTTEIPCEGAQGIRVQLQGNQNLSSAQLKSPSIGTCQGGTVNYSFDYKWLVYNSNMLGQVAGANPNSLELLCQWGNTSSGPWYTFKTIDATNHVQSNVCSSITGQFTPSNGPLFVRFVSKNKTASSNNYLYLDNLNFVEDSIAVACKIPVDPYVASKNDQSFTVNWSPPSSSVVGYEWEIRTSGEPGTGGAGYVNGGGPITVPTLNSGNGLTSETNYKVYIRALCSATEFSGWIGIDVTTFCSMPNPNVQSVINICGIQEVPINVTGAAGGTSYFYDANNVLVHSGTNSYTTPPLSASTNYQVFTGVPNSTATSGMIGTGASTTTIPSPFTTNKSHKLQVIYTADELKAAGFSRGVIRGFSLKTGNTAGTLLRKNLVIHMGLTTLEEYALNSQGNASFIPTNRLTVVKNSSDQVVAASTDIFFQLDNAFAWDGESNLVVQFTHSDVPGTNPTATNFEVNNLGGVYRTLYAGDNVSNLTSLQNNTLTGTRSDLRVKPTLSFLDGCFSTNRNVQINYTTAPNLVLSTYAINNCAGQPLQKAYVLTGAADYDTFTWSPDSQNNPGPDDASVAISGDQNVGWTFNPTRNMTYTLKASSSTGQRCVIEQQVTVNFSDSPQLLQLQDDYKLCFNDVQEIKVIDNVNDIKTIHNFNGSITSASISNGVTGDAILNETTLFSEGSGSLNIQYAAQSTAAVTLNNPVSMSNLKGLEVQFDHIAALQSTNTAVNDFGYVEYSVDNGVTWKPFLKNDYVGQASVTLPTPVGQTASQRMFFSKTSYSDWSTIQQNVVPSTISWKTEKFILPEADVTGTGNFKIRFRIGADGNTQFNGWFIDNVRITPINNYQVTWSPVANLYYDQAATQPYDGLINTGKLYIKGNTNSANVNYTVNVVNKFGCSAQDIFKVSIGLNKAPVTNTITQCGPLDVVNTGFTKEPNGVLRYYSSLTSTSVISQITTSGVYYVEQEISGCKSIRTPFTVVISPLATTPVATAVQTFCGSATVANLQVTPMTGFQINWYQTATGGTPLAPTSPIATGNYYVEFDNGTCVSPSRAMVSVNVGVTPAPITLGPISICGTNTTINSISVSAVTGATVNWYQNVNDTTPLLGTTNLTTGTYYIAQKVGNCESTRTAVTVNTIQNLGLPNAVAQQFCGSATVGNLVATGDPGASIYWYSFSTSDTPLSPSAPISSGTYYVSQGIGDCLSAKRAVTITIISTNAPVINPINLCGDATVSSLPLNANATTTYKVYTSPYATTELGQNAVINSGTYYVSKVENACESAKAAVQITVNARPGSPTGNATQVFYDQAKVSQLVMNESNVVWFASYNDALNNLNPLPSYQPLLDNTTYYGVIVGNGGCTSIPTPVTVKIVAGTVELDLASLKYYPNPTDSDLTISYKETIKSVEVYDILGKLVKTNSFDSNQVQLNLGNLASGTYMVKVITESGSQFVKIVKR